MSTGALPSPKVISWGEWGDVLLVCFPLWIPLCFVLSFQFSPTVLAPVALVVFFVFREVHFGATWLFFMVPENRSWIRQRPWVSTRLPLLILGGLLFVLLTFGFATAFFLTNLASWFHVTRQSVGVARIYSVGNFGAYRTASRLIYFFSAAFLFIGFFRFYSGVELRPPEFLTLVWAGGIACVVATVVLALLGNAKGLSWRFYLTALTGMLIFYPYCFVENIEHALLIGVGMHWMQYICLVSAVYWRRSAPHGGRVRKPEEMGIFETVASQPALFGSFLVLYPLMIALLNVAGQAAPGGTIAMVCSFVVLGSYNLHFYFDAFIWRFSDAHIRSEVGAFLFQSETQSPILAEAARPTVRP